MSKEDKLLEESRATAERTKQFVRFYTLPKGSDYIEITDQLLESPLVDTAEKVAIAKTNRRIFVFEYPSDGLKIKGVISYVPNPEINPVLIFLRGGNKVFGLLNPGADIMCASNYTVLSTMLRDGVSEGQDEYGGADVNDVKNLIEYIPILETKLNIHVQDEKMYLMGGSRGGMEMFLALSRFPELQDRFLKIVSLSGLLDMNQTITNRPDMKQMLTEFFGYQEGAEGEEWIRIRNPILAVENIRKDLPILILQGSEDLRVDLTEGYEMVRKLQANGNRVSYLEIQGADHCLYGLDGRMQIILNWLEE